MSRTMLVVRYIMKSIHIIILSSFMTLVACSIFFPGDDPIGTFTKDIIFIPVQVVFMYVVFEIISAIFYALNNWRKT